ncbi:MAG: DUF805 domain-containing protein [Pseudomonadota bacterium]
MNDRLQQATGGRTPPVGGFWTWIGGRGRRREYWLWMVPLLLAGVALSLTSVPGAALIVALPKLFAMIRRLHDIGQSGWIAVIINVASNIGSFVLILIVGVEGGALLAYLAYLAALVVLGAWPGQRTTNAYGPPTGKAGELAEAFR